MQSTNSVRKIAPSSFYLYQISIVFNAPSSMQPFRKDVGHELVRVGVAWFTLLDG